MEPPGIYQPVGKQLTDHMPFSELKEDKNWILQVKKTVIWGQAARQLRAHPRVWKEELI